MTSLIEENTIVTIYKYSVYILYIVTILFLLSRYTELLYSEFGYLGNYINSSLFISLKAQYLQCLVNSIVLHWYSIFFVAQQFQYPLRKGHSNITYFYRNSILYSSKYIINNKIPSKVMNFHY